MADIIMIMLLGYQIVMPNTSNGKYSFHIDKDGSIIRMNTQDGTMVKCDKELKCPQEEKNE